LKRNTPTDVKVADRADHISQIEKDENGSNNWGNIYLNETGEFIIKRWLTDAKRVGRTRFEQQSKDIRSQLHDAIGSLDVEDTTTRMEGNALKIDGDQIAKLKESHETKLSKQLDSLRSDFDLALKEFAEREKEKTEESEASLSQLQTISQRKQESRTLELNKMIDISTSEEETAALRSLLTMEMEDEDRLLQSKINELKTQVADSLKRLDRERHSTLNSYGQKRVNLWVGKTSRGRGRTHFE
jgi:flagellar biosynthesis GTPase FlhF